MVATGIGLIVALLVFVEGAPRSIGVALFNSVIAFLIVAILANFVLLPFVTVIAALFERRGRRE